ncbi:MAG: Rieske (2Fe-2S) iron-sulfur domain protein [Frankiales bacterium]|nr:Rieske (2Fe-2S) iron-sulfur domain protein [Frankiales bacterium]
MARLAALLDSLVERAAASRAANVTGRGLGAVPPLPPGPVKDLLSGTPVGHPVHPVLTVATAGLLVGSNVLDAVGEPAAARKLLTAGLLTAPATVAAGWSDWSDTEGREKQVGVVHASSNALGLSLYAASWLARRRGGTGVGLALAGSALLGVGGWLGGHLAYALGVGVDTTAFEAGPQEWTDVAAADAVGDGPVQVEVGDVALVLVRRQGVVSALADRCTHRGGPLSDGTLEDGCLVCPWHGSSFDAGTGAVVRGPATRPQPAYDVREVAGRLQARRRESRALPADPV